MQLLKPKPLDSGLPKIDADNQDLPRITEEAWNALINANVPPSLFRYGDQATRIETNDGDAPVPKSLTPDRFRYEMARRADFYKVNKDGRIKPALPPMYVIRDMLATRPTGLAQRVSNVSHRLSVLNRLT